MALELQIEQAFNPLEEQLKGQLVEIVRDTQLRLFQSYVELRRTSLPPVSTVDTNDRSGQDPQNVFANPTAESRVNQLMVDPIIEQLAPYNAPPFVSDFCDAGLEAILFDMQHCNEFDFSDNFHDSAYQSGRSCFTGEEEQWDALLKAGADIDSSTFDNGEGPSGTRR